MNENIKRQQISFMGYNLIAFTIIFTLFGFILYSQIRLSLYSPVEQSLLHSRQIILESDDYVAHQLSLQNERGAGQEPRPQKERGSPPGFQAVSIAVPMRIHTILRDDTGQVLNTRALGRIYFDGYLDRIPYEEAEWERPFSFRLDSSDYNALIFTKQAGDGKIYTVQLLANMDGEKAVLDSFFRLLAICVTAFILLSITASYLLSRKTMTPLIRSWRRQSEFVEDASHELRTPLTIVQSRLEAMLTAPDATIMDKAEDIVVSLSEMRRLSKLTADLMTLARADSSEVQLEKEHFFIDELIKAVTIPYQDFALSQGKALSLSLACRDKVLADRNRIHQLMVILLDNALKYTGEKDQINIRTEVLEKRVIIEVSDTGIGIPSSCRERVFDRFYRVDKARSRESGGSGLGLSIAKWIVDAHEGDITIFENSSKGTTIQIQLKL